jgi:hypothetical protein
MQTKEATEKYIGKQKCHPFQPRHSRWDEHHSSFHQFLCIYIFILSMFTSHCLPIVDLSTLKKSTGSFEPMGSDTKIFCTHVIADAKKRNENIEISNAFSRRSSRAKGLTTANAGSLIRWCGPNKQTAESFVLNHPSI